MAVQTGLGALTNGDIVGLALDLDSTPNTVTFTKNGSALGTAVSVTSGFTWTPCEGTNPTGYTANVNTSHNFGQDGTFAGTETAQDNADANGIGNFYYAPPTNFLALCSANLPDPTIGPQTSTQADNHFDTLIWTGDGSSPRILVVLILNLIGYGIRLGMVAVMCLMFYMIVQEV